MSAMTGAAAASRTVVPARSKARFTSRDERVSPKRRTPSIVRPSTWSNSTDEPTTSNRRGNTVTRTPSSFATRITSSISEASVLRGATITRSISSRRTAARTATVRSSASAPGGTGRTVTTSASASLSSSLRTSVVTACESPTTRHRWSPPILRATRRASIRPVRMRPVEPSHRPATCQEPSTYGVTGS